MRLIFTLALMLGFTAQAATDVPKLPIGYTSLGSVTVPRDRYVDTGYRPNHTTHVVMDVTVQGAGEYWFGCWDADYNRGAFALGNDGWGIYAGYGNQGGTFGNVVANGRQVVELDGNEAKVDEIKVREFTAESFSLAHTLYLFGQNRKGTLGVAASQQSVICHGCRIYEDGTLKRHYVPCKKEFGVVGFYDGVDKIFYPLLHNLPADYKEVGAIVAPRGAYIDTGYKPNQSSRTTMDVTVQGKAEYWFSVSGANYTTDAYALCNDYDLGIYYAVDDDGGSFKSENAKSNEGCVPNGRHTVEITPYSFLMDGEVWKTKESKGSFQLENNLYLFASHAAVVHSAYTRDTQNAIICHGCTIKEGETLKRNFVPCVRIADAVAGLYDTVERKFYANAGSGVFTLSASTLPFERTLTSGTYAVESSVAFIAPPTESAITVAAGATVVLYIPEGVTMALRGGDAVGSNGAGAGIEVPESSTLVVTGGGRLAAYGGNGADGSRGGDAPAGEGAGAWSDTSRGSSGGVGGTGGGGAGAGIGGRGGSGGLYGGSAGSASSGAWDAERSGTDGGNGLDGFNGHPCGAVYVFGTCSVEAFGGAAGLGGEAGKSSDWAAISGSSWSWAGYGGGGGGGGGSGMSARGIGGGGGGGGAGGGGGGGGAAYDRSDQDIIEFKLNGKGGAGGKGGLTGADGKTRSGWATLGGETSYAESLQHDGGKNGGRAGGGGNNGSSGDFGEAYRSAAATVTGRTYFNSTTETTHEAIKYRITFVNQDSKLMSVPPDADVYLGMPYPEIDSNCTTVNADESLVGWYTQPVGGEKVYGVDGKPLPAAYDRHQGDLTLYPQFDDTSVKPTGVTLNGQMIGGPDDKNRHGDGWFLANGVVNLTGSSNDVEFVLSGTNLLGGVRFRAEKGANALALAGVNLQNDRADIGGVIDVLPGAQLTVRLTGTENALVAKNAAAIHCPVGATVRIVYDGDAAGRFVRTKRASTAKDSPEYELGGGGFQLMLESGNGAAEIGGVRGEFCGDITLDNCDIELSASKAAIVSSSVHAVGNGEMEISPRDHRGGSVTFVRAPSFTGDDAGNWNTLQNQMPIASPRPHDENGIPLSAIHFKDGGRRTYVYTQPGSAKIGKSEGDSITFKVPRSGEVKQ